MDTTNSDKARLLQIECELQGMIAREKQQEYLGEPMAWYQEDFNVLVGRISKLIER